MEYTEISGSKIPLISAKLTLADLLGGLMVRFDINRNNYKVRPGLYGIGKPGQDSPVLVTANYKLSFDIVRKNLEGLNAWLIVLDTKGINVWCAAGKGTFGTIELVKRIIESGLEKIVSHRTVILPQLGAVGVSAYKARMMTKFKIVYGPVRACDIKKFIAGGMEKDAGMSEVSFNWRDRLAVAPVELVQSSALIAALIILGAVFSLPFDKSYAARLAPLMIQYIAAVLAGVFVFPLLLPYLPFRAFSLKGGVLGILYCLLIAFICHISFYGSLIMSFITIPVISFIAMNFTGSSTFTSQAGATLEVKRSIPVMAVVFIAGISLNILKTLNILGGH
jgi:hypothetical protein